MNKIKIHSNRTGADYDVDVYEKEGNMILRHSSLEQIYYGMSDSDRPTMQTQLLDLNFLPKIPPMFAVECTISGKEGSVTQIGELTCEEWERTEPIKRGHPLTACQNIAFDRAFIRFMQFDMDAGAFYSLYSDLEIPMEGAKAIPVMSKNLSETIESEQENEVQIPSTGEYEEMAQLEDTSREGYVQSDQTYETEENIELPPEEMEENLQYVECGSYNPDEEGYSEESYIYNEESQEYPEENLYPNGGFQEDYVLEDGNNYFSGNTESDIEESFYLEDSSETMEAPMPEGIDSGISSLPWFTPNDSAQTEEWSIPAPCEYGVQVSAKKLEVFQVKYDANLDKAKIITGEGLVYYNRFTQNFEADQINLDEYDLNLLYNSVYDEFHIDLSKFDGAIDC